MSTNVKPRKTKGDDKLLHRAISTIPANQSLVNHQRNILAQNYRRTEINDEIVTIDHEDADALFSISDLSQLSEEIRLRVMNNLVDTLTMTALEETKRLNWWVDQPLSSPKLYILVTSGDGNCLLHATSIAMWGFHDHALSMRRALNETLITSKPNSSLYRRWRWAQSIQNKKCHWVLSEQEWQREWKHLLRLSSAEPRNSQKKFSHSTPPVDQINHPKSSEGISGGSTKSSGQSTRYSYESLEEFHVYVLANNIRRPIIIFSNTMLRSKEGEAISPIEFGGIYLPLEIPPDQCHKQPVFLTFNTAHFSALVPMESASKVTYQIPLIDMDTFDLLPIHFLIDPGLNFSWPIDQELSDETIRSYTNDEDKRFDILEKYFNLSKKCISLNDFIIPSSVSTFSDDQKLSTGNSNSTNNDLFNETNSNKKFSRSSMSSLSKAMSRTFLDPFSSTKRALLKHQHYQIGIMNESSSSLLNRHAKTLTMILVNFQPKRSKTSDNMIKNYIQTCITETHPKPMNRSHEKLEKNCQSKVFYRHHLSLTNNQSQQENVLLENSAYQTNDLTQHAQKNGKLDGQDDWLPRENEQIPTNIYSIRHSQRK